MQAKGHRFDPGQLHQLCIEKTILLKDGSPGSTRCSILEQSYRLVIADSDGKVPQGTHRMAMLRMFDNEIDWVKHYKAEQYSRPLLVIRDISNVQVECL